MPELSTPIMYLMGDIVDPKDVDLHNLDAAQFFFTRSAARDSVDDDREVAEHLLGLAGVRLQLHNTRGAGNTLAHFSSRFKGKYRDLEQIASFYNVVSQIYDGNYQRAAELTDRLIVDTDKLRDRKRLECLQKMFAAEILLRTGKPKDALVYLDRAQERLKGDASQRVDLVLTCAIYWLYGRAHMKSGSLNDALLCFNRACTVADHIAYPVISIRAQMGRGQVYSKLKQHNEAFSQLRDTLRTSKEICLHYDVVLIALALGRAYYSVRQYHNAYLFFEEARLLCADGKFPAVEAEVNSRIGDIFVTEGRYEQAYSRYKSDLEISGKLGDSVPYAHAVKNMGRIQRLLGKYEESREYLAEAYKLFASMNDYHEQISVLLQLIFCYMAQGKSDEAKITVDAYVNSLMNANIPAEAGILQMLEGMLRRREGNYSEAIVNLETSYEIFQQDPGFYAVLCTLELAQVYHESNLKDKAVECYTTCIKLARKLNMHDMAKRALVMLAKVDKDAWGKLLHDQGTGREESGSINRLYVTFVMFELRANENNVVLETRQLSQLLDQYFDIVNKIILENGGIINNIMGSRVLAVFGMKDSLEPMKILASALEVIHSMDRVLPKEIKEVSKGSVGVAASLATGDAFGGDFGPIGRRDYGFFGELVDLSQALLSNAEVGEALLSQAAMRSVSEFVEQPQVRDIYVPRDLKTYTAHCVSALKS